MPSSTLSAAVATVAILIAAPAARAIVPTQNEDMAELSLEELANIQVTSVSKRSESLSDAAASIFVITGTDIRHVGALPRPGAPAYTAVDARWGWRIRPGVELAIIGQNLFDPRRAEFGSPATRSEYERALAVRVVWTP